MGTTTKMAIPYPEATGLVKDGWEDMKDIATQVDAKSGLILLNTTTFSGVSSQSISNFVTSSYTYYKVVYTITGSTNMTLNFRFRENVTDKASNYYGASWYYRYNSTSGLGAAKNNGNEAVIGATKSGGYCSGELFYSLPSTTVGYVSGNCYEDDGAGGWSFGYSVGNVTAVTGLSVIPTSGNMTGTIGVYGFNK